MASVGEGISITGRRLCKKIELYIHHAKVYEISPMFAWKR
jgi:hypothetical protein